jgi:hypothetical protein
VSHEVMDKLSGLPNAQEVLATKSGASVLIGGWL